jgi:hypothetical protein
MVNSIVCQHTVKQRGNRDYLKVKLIDHHLFRYFNVIETCAVLSIVNATPLMASYHHGMLVRGENVSGANEKVPVMGSLRGGCFV